MLRFVRVVVCAFLALSVAGCRTQVLYSGLGQREANEMLAILEAAGYSGVGTTADARGATLSLMVPTGDAASASRALARFGLPRDKRTSLTDVLPKESYLASPSDDRARLAYGISQELTSTLMHISGVSQARVHVALAEKNALGQVVSPPSASVLIRHNPEILRGDFQDSVRSIIASSVTGLTYDRVAVTMMPEDVIPATAREPQSAMAGFGGSLGGGQGLWGVLAGIVGTLLLGVLAFGIARVIRSRAA
jgi:type III secretion protein J